jgi:hypothetical protein
MSEGVFIVCSLPVARACTQLFIGSAIPSFDYIHLCPQRFGCISEKDSL